MMASKSETTASVRPGLFATLRAWLKQGTIEHGITKEEAIEIVRRYYDEQGWDTRQTFFEARPSAWRDGDMVVQTFEVDDGWKDSGHIHVRRSDGKLLVLTVPRKSPTPLPLEPAPSAPPLNDTWLPPHPVELEGPCGSSPQNGPEGK